jgi:diguanylate cyclase (GGDEF)-like protein
MRSRSGNASVLPSLAAVVAAALAAFAPLQAESKPISQYINRVWRTENGLPQSSVQAIVQTRSGHLWLGTQEGLVRFTGIDFTVFDKKTQPAFRNNDIRALIEGRDRLWIGTANGLLSYRNGGFRTHFTNRPAADFISGLFEDAEGTLWIGTYGGLGRLRENRFDFFTTLDGLASNVVTAVCRDRAGIVWIGTADGLNRMKDGRISVYTRTDGLPHDFITALQETGDGSLWIGTRGGLARLKDGRFRVYTTRDGLTSDSVISLYEDREGCLWIGAERKGLNRFEAGVFTSFTMKDGLSDDYVLSICQDREGLIWVGTYAGGLNRLWKGKFTTYTTHDGLPGDDVRVILEARDGSFWIGVREGGLARFRNGEITAYSMKDGLPDNTVRALFEDDQGRLWIGTNNGLSCFRDGRFVNYSRRDGLAHDFVRCIVQDPAGRIWVGTTGGGLHLFDRGRLIPYLDRGIPDTVIRSLTVARDGSLWIGANDGLAHWRDGVYTRYSSESGLSADPVYAIHEDAAGTFWIGTYGGGLYRFKDGRFTAITIRQGLFNDVVFQILEDDAGSLWMTCNVGLYRVRKSDLNDFADGRTASVECVSYGMADGLRSAECNGNAQPAGWRARDGRLWFPTIAGVVVIDPARIEHNTQPPLVAIDRALIDAVEYCPVLDAVAPPGGGSLEFQFAGLSFIAPERVKFRYRLEGYDRGWIEAGNRRGAYYTNIPPGRYRFLVTACNNDGLWNTEGASFEFRLRSHYYQTVWFYGLGVLALAGAVLAFYQIRVGRLKARERTLAGLVDERTRDLAETNRKLTRAARELKRLANTDGLTGVSSLRHFRRVLDAEWRRAKRQEIPLSLITADVDYFKAYNDNYGHHAGDRCLRAIARQMKETATRAGDLVGRCGGDEFVALLPATDAGGAAAVAERLRGRVEALGIRHEFSPVSDRVTLSIGVSTRVPGRKQTKEALIKASDAALYRAKRAGRNRSIS